MQKRDFLKLMGLGSSILAVPAFAQGQPSTAQDTLRPITHDVVPISVEERLERIARAQQLMREHEVVALVLEPGAAMTYFTGLEWWRSERLTGVIIPQKGEIAVVTPFFEAPSVRETLLVGNDVRVWQEHESPFAQVAAVIADRQLPKGAIGFEHSVRYFVVAGVLEALPGYVSTAAEPITRGCRMYKTAAELQLMHKAADITLRAYAHVIPRVQVGMTQGQVKQMMQQAQVSLGGQKPWSMALFDEASAYPHGTRQEPVIKEGSVVLMDCGCSVEGYQSDISRTFFVGTPSAKAVKVWQHVRQGQEVAMQAARIGVAAGKVDDAVRAHYHTLGYGPDYALPGLSHRTGHGIGMEGHESVNFVRGETTLLSQGMCFSNEPGLYLPGEFGVRIEDCIYMTDKGPEWFTRPPVSWQSPVGELAPLKV